MPERTHNYPPAEGPASSDDDELALAEQLLASPADSRRVSLAHQPQQSPRWAQQPGGASGGWRKWQGRQPLRPNFAFFVAFAALAGVVLFGGAASTQPHVRDFVKERVEHYTGHAPIATRRANASIVILVNPYSNMYQALLPTLENIELKFNRRYGYPIQLLTDGNLPSAAILNRTDYITGGKANWSVVTPEQGWGPPEWVSQKDINEGLRKIPFPLGYRNMCRFFSMWHWRHPALQGYDWIFRLDEGIHFHCELMEENNKTYGFTNVDQEAPFVVPTLWQTTQQFMRQAPRHYFPEGRDESFVSNDGGKNYNYRMYYNNFEIVHRSVDLPPTRPGYAGALTRLNLQFFESEAYQAYVNHLDRAGGFYKERWGDAPIRTIAASYFLPTSALHSFANVTGYRHDLPPFTCPDLPYIRPDYVPLQTTRLEGRSSSLAVVDLSGDGAEGNKHRLTAADLRASFAEEGSAPSLRQAARSRRERLALIAALLAALLGAALTASLLAVRSSATTAVPAALDAPNAPDGLWAPPCAARKFSTGRWVPRTPPPAENATVWASTGFSGCAQNWFRGDWHLGLEWPSEGNPAGPAGEWPMSAYRRQAGGWAWAPEDETCKALDDEEDEEQVQGVQVRRLLQDLVDRGGWLVVGDSLSEQQFFSLSCLLFPHVRALWPYPPMSEWHQIKEEHLHLDPASPLIATGELRLPEGFDFEGTPLISHVRTDHGLAPSELVDVYAAFHATSPPALAERYPALASLPPHANRQSILTDVETFSPALDYYLDLFLRPSSTRNITTGISPSYAPDTTPPDSLAVERNATRSAHYRALIFSTAAHFSARHFNLPPGDVEYAVPTSVDANDRAIHAHKEHGSAQVEFFELVVEAWAARVDEALRSATPQEREGKVVIVRPSSGGHNDCHSATRPLQEGEGARSDWYSWGDMPKMNDKAQALVAQVGNPQMVFLDLARPANLRPDAHTNDDCLHLSTGTGVIEGWTRYISYYLRARSAFDAEATLKASGGSESVEVIR
ncbi:hypothetical protein JCM3770_004601 [Rhodotorula araucariae]